MMKTSYGFSRRFGSTQYGCSGMDSSRAAILHVYEAAFEYGSWRPEALRDKWWQFWRPKSHNHETQIFIDANPDWQQRESHKRTK